MAALGLVVGPVGVGDQLEVADDLAEPGRVEAPGGFEQDWFGVGGELVGEVVGAVASTVA